MAAVCITRASERTACTHRVCILGIRMRAYACVYYYYTRGFSENMTGRWRAILHSVVCHTHHLRCTAQCTGRYSYIVCVHVLNSRQLVLDLESYVLHGRLETARSCAENSWITYAVRRTQDVCVRLKTTCMVGRPKNRVSNRPGHCWVKPSRVYPRYLSTAKAIRSNE